MPAAIDAELPDFKDPDFRRFELPSPGREPARRAPNHSAAASSGEPRTLNLCLRLLTVAAIRKKDAASIRNQQHG
jgi:hypothetical protein